MKKAVQMVIASLLVMAVSFTGGYALAHTITGGSESQGWLVSSYGHLDTLVDTWVNSSIGPCPTLILNAFKQGNDNWYAAYNPPRVNYYESTSSSNNIYCYNDPNDVAYARVQLSTTKQNGDSIWFNVKFNLRYTRNQDAWAQTAAHEIGHIVGLADLYQSGNSGKLMYGYANSVTSPTTKDKEGVNYIWGNP